MPARRGDRGRVKARETADRGLPRPADPVLRD